MVRHHHTFRLFAKKVRSFTMDSLKNNPRWHNMWNAGLLPGQAFDACGPSPALLKIVEEQSIIQSGRCLVPGCGRAYDLAALCSESRYVLGVDIAEQAVVAANEWLSQQNLPVGMYEAKLQNFFDLDQNDKFDLIYDYTFLCALDPTIRTDWATKMSDLVKPGGELITLIYPIYPDDYERTGGPPFRVSLRLLEELLLPVGFSCDYLDYLPKELSHRNRAGEEIIIDGNVKLDGRSGLGRWKRL
jgi:SAM-dependent methyltransferase